MESAVTIHTQTGSSAAAQAFYSTIDYHYPIEPAAIVVSATSAGAIIGIVRIVPEHGTTTLRGMQISPSWQRQGVGQLMLDELVKHIRGECYCLPHSWLEGFYSHIGFESISPQVAPAYLQQRLAGNLTQFPHLIVMKRPA